MTPTFVLARPQMGENIGAAARAMLNFGLDRMRVVDPRDGWPNPAASAMAAGAGRVLDAATVHPSIASGVGDCAYVYATTARMRDMTKEVLSPEEAMRDAAARVAEGQHVAVMFGPERAGLENEDLARANALVAVPANPDFPSLNLAQCVLLLGYEWRRASADVAHRVTGMAGTAWAERDEVDHLARHFEERLEEAGFFFPEQKAPSMKTNLRNLWSRMPLTRADVQTLHGVLRQMVRWADRR